MGDVVRPDAKDVTPQERWVLYSREKALLLECEKELTHKEMELRVRALVDKYGV
ncbi:hypothetical protein ACEUAK_00115 [Aeromonas veronii]